MNNPHETNRLVWESLPAAAQSLIAPQQAMSNIYAPVDRRRLRLDPQSYLTQYRFVCLTPTLRLTHFSNRMGYQLAYGDLGEPPVKISLLERGSLSNQGREGQEVSLRPGQGLVLGPDCRDKTSYSDDSSGWYLSLSSQLLRGRLESLLGDYSPGMIEFRSVFSDGTQAIKTLYHLCEVLSLCSSGPETSLSNDVFLKGIQENLLLAVLLGLPHNYSERLNRHPSAAPRNVRRAEDFMREHLTEPMTLEMIAEAAGCSIRALQLAFQKTRGQSPAATIRAMRLEAADRDLQTGTPGTSIIAVAETYGFANAGRFARYYAARFGRLPSVVLKERARDA